MIDGGQHPSAASTNNSNNSSQANAHNLIRSILFRHTHNHHHGHGQSATAKSDVSSSRHPSTDTATASTTSRTANSSLETSPNHPLYVSAMRVTPTKASSVGSSASGGSSSNDNNGSSSRKHFPKFPSLLLGHQVNYHHHHQRTASTTTTGNGSNHGNSSNSISHGSNPSAVRYAVPRRSGGWGRYHRAVGGLSASGHRRQAAAARRQQEDQKVAAHQVHPAAKGNNQAEPSQEVVRHAQIHPRPGLPQDQARANQAPTTGNGNPNSQAVNLVANLRRATHITADQPPYTNLPHHHHPPSALPTNANANVDPCPLPKSSSSAAIPIPSHHIKRTASELQLCEDEMRAEYRDRVMYVRCYPAIAGATTARRATMQQQGQGQGQQHQVPTSNLAANAAHRHTAGCRRSTAPPVLSHDSGDADWLLYDDDHPLAGSSPSSCGARAGAGIDTSGAVDGIERSANPRMSYADDVEAEVNVEVEPSPSSSPIVQNPTPPKDGGWPVACSQTRRNISILRQASETLYSTTTKTTAATPSAATTGATTTPSSSNPASRATSRTTSREEGDFNPYYQDDAGASNGGGGEMLLDGDGYLEGELRDYEHPDDPHRVGGGGSMPPKSAGGGRRKNSASSYEDVFVIDDL